MNDIHKKIDIFIQHEFYDTHFSDLKYASVKFENKIFENCQFTDSTFNEAKFIRCKFIDCEFKTCNLSSAQFDQTSFSEVVFAESKLIGINWTRVKWPLIKLSSPLKFYKSNISHSSFYELELSEIIIDECKAHDVDFREGDFSQASFVLTDLERSLFMHTKLYAADFTDAFNYHIDPMNNNIHKAKFSLPDALNLLNSFDIEIKN